MIDSDSETSIGANVWISFADVFAGLMLIVLMGLFVVLSKHSEKNMQFSLELMQAINQAKKITVGMQAKLRAQLPDMAYQIQEDETEIVIPAESLFASCNYRASEGKKELLKTIGQALKESLDRAGDDRKYLRIIIEGHTDSDQMGSLCATKEVPTNWELSSLRATGVLRFFEENGLNAQKYNIVASGLADTVPVAPNDTDPNKARNRRIVIRIEPDINKLKTDLIKEAR